MPLTKLDTTTAPIVIDLQKVMVGRPTFILLGKSLTMRPYWLTHSAATVCRSYS